MSAPVQLRLTPVQMRGYDESLDDVMLQWGQFWAAFSRPARLFASVHGVSFDPLRAALQRQARRIEPWYHAGDVRGWAWPWVLNYAYMYDVLEELAPPLAVDHYALFWPQHTTQRETLAQTVRTAFRLPEVVEQPLPALIPGRYREHAGCLEPLEAGYPWLAVLLAYDVQGRWTPQTWSPLLLGDVPLVLAIDIQTIPRGRALAQVTAAYNRLWAATQTAGAVRDPESQAGFEAADQVLAQLATEALHLLTYAVLVQAPTRQELERRVEQVRQTAAAELQGATLQLDLIGGSQGEAAKLFTPRPRTAIALPLVQRNTLSLGLAAKTPFGVRKTAGTEGVCLGIGATGLPHIRQIWREAQGNAHAMILGMSGAGKTTSVLALLLRLATAADEPAQVVFVDPLGKGKLLADAVGEAGAFYEISDQATINVLDPVAADLGSQLAAVRPKLAMILGRPDYQEGDAVLLVPYPFTTLELRAVDLALERVYGLDGARLRAMRDGSAPIPVLADLITALAAVVADGVVEGGAVLRELTVLLKTAEGQRLWNRPTTLHWDFTHPITAYSFRAVAKELRPIYYGAIFGGMDDHVRHGRRGSPRQRFIGCIDEFFVMRSVPALGEYVRRAAKTWRNEGAAMWTMDQNVGTWFDSTQGDASAGQMTAENVRIRLIFHLEGQDARRVAALYGDRLKPEDLRAIRTASAGACVALFGGDVEHLTIALTDLEARALIDPVER